MNNSTTQSRESGAVLGFVLVLLVLAGLLAGGLWFIKYRADIAGRVDTVSKQVKDKAADTKTKTEEKAAETKKDDTQSQTSTTQPSGQSQTQQQGTTSPSTPAQTAPSTSSASTQSANPAAVASTGPSHIASTGPGDVLMNAYLLGSLAIVGYLYRQSRSVTR